jgi:hypothetical protein
LASNHADFNAVNFAIDRFLRACISNFVCDSMFHHYSNFCYIWINCCLQKFLRIVMKIQRFF